MDHNHSEDDEEGAAIRRHYEAIDANNAAQNSEKARAWDSVYERLSRTKAFATVSASGTGIERAIQTIDEMERRALPV